MKLTETKTKRTWLWLIKNMWPYMKPVLGRVFLGVLVAVPVGLLEGVTAFVLKPYLDYVVNQKDLAFTVWGNDITLTAAAMAYAIPLAVVVFAALQGVLRYLNEYLTDWTSQKMTNSVKIALFNRLVSMDTALFDDNDSGAIFFRYFNDADAASTSLISNLKTLITSAFGAVSLVFVLLYNSWRLALVGITVLALAFIPVYLIRKRVKRTSNRNMVIGSSIVTNFHETTSGNRIMRSYGLEQQRRDIFRQQVNDAFNNNMSLVKRAAWMSPLMYLIASVGIAIVLGYGTSLIGAGKMSVGGFSSFVTSLLLLYKPVKTIGTTLTNLQNVLAAAGRVFELFDIKPEITDIPEAVEMDGLKQGIEFQDVSFSYRPDVPVLRHLNLSIKKNEMLALVGNSGGGKSTVANLLPRFYDVVSGNILFDGRDIRSYTLKSLRANISMVFQDNFLFSGTIRENIMMGNPSATEEDLRLAVESAHLEELAADLPQGLDTPIAEGGKSLSGGQRQRVAIARAMIKNAPIVVLDEATSALDNKSEGIVQKALDNLMKNRTVIVIAHRLSTIKNADRIAVLNEGELAELGTHDELMAIENGQYRQLYEMQFQQQKAAGEDGEDTGAVAAETYASAELPENTAIPEITGVQENKSTGKESTDGIKE